MKNKEFNQNLLHSLIPLGQEVRVAIEISTKTFLQSDLTEWEFPSSFNFKETQYVQIMASFFNLKCISKFQNGQQKLVLVKQNFESSYSIQVTLSCKSKYFLSSYFSSPSSQINWNTNKCLMRGLSNSQSMLRMSSLITGKLPLFIPQVPLECRDPHPQNGPVWNKRGEILRALDIYQFVILNGPPGIGKSTQISQLLLEQATARQTTCAIVHAQPYRIQTVALAERVAQERGEQLGQTVGFQIGLESKLSPKTLAIFCTSSILLRSLISDDHVLQSISHVILDELDTCDPINELLITYVHEAYQKHPTVKFVFVSSGIHAQTLSEYLGNCAIINCETQTYPVNELYLEQILELVSDEPNILCEPSTVLQTLNNWLSYFGINDNRIDQIKDVYWKTNDYVSQADLLLQQLWYTADKGVLRTLLNLLPSTKSKLDYAHSKSSITLLVTLIVQKNILAFELVLQMGVDLNLRTANGLNPIDWAKLSNNDHALKLLQAYSGIQPFLKSSLVNVQLIIRIINYIMLNERFLKAEDRGNILVFLPGYAEIYAVRNALIQCDKLRCLESFIILSLHAYISSTERRKLLALHESKRKIFLATSVAETQLGLHEIRFVINSALQDIDMAGHLLQPLFVSRCVMLTRANITGKKLYGQCFHLINSSIEKQLITERAPPFSNTCLTSLCLSAQLLSKNQLVSFFQKSIQPAPILEIQEAIHSLQVLDALDSKEQPTCLGLNLLDLPLPPQLGKAILHSLVLKCLDPVLTIACSLAFRAPFTPSCNSVDIYATRRLHTRLASNTFSDHLVLLRTFQCWQRARSEGNEQSFVNDTGIQAATLELIVGLRAQILGQLRAAGFIKTRSPGDIKDLNSFSECWPLVKAAFCAVNGRNIIFWDNIAQCFTFEGKRVHLLSTSTITQSILEQKKFPSKCAIAHEIHWKNEIPFAIGISFVSAFSLAILGDCNRLRVDNFDIEKQTNSDSKNQKWLHFDNWYQIQSSSEDANALLQLRQKYFMLFKRRMENPGKISFVSDDETLKTIANILRHEEQLAGFVKPIKVGERPLQISTDFCPLLICDLKENNDNF